MTSLVLVIKNLHCHCHSRLYLMWNVEFKLSVYLCPWFGVFGPNFLPFPQWPNTLTGISQPSDAFTMSPWVRLHLMWNATILTHIGDNVHKNLCCSSVTSRCIFIPFEQYRCPKKCTQKSSCNTFSIYISHKN